MKIIKINRNSIKRNPTAGETETHIPMAWKTTFEIEGDIPDFINYPPFFIEEWKMNNGIMIKASGKINGFFDTKWIEKAPNLKISSYRDIQTIRYFPEPEYLFDYEETFLKCKHCKNKIDVEEIEQDYVGDDEILIETCPICKHENTFPKYKYEKIEDVLKDKK